MCTSVFLFIKTEKTRAIFVVNSTVTDYTLKGVISEVEIHLVLWSFGQTTMEMNAIGAVVL